MPSTEEAFGVSYIEAMAGGVPAIGTRGEPGPEEIAAAGGGIELVDGGRRGRLARLIDDAALLAGAAARAWRTRAGTVSGALHVAALRRADAWRLRARAAMKPVLFVTGHAPADRVGAFACLHERENVFFALFGGRLQHGAGPAASELAFPHREVRQRDVFELAPAAPTERSCAPRAAGRRCRSPGQARVAEAPPLILWSSLWAHPRSAPHALSYLALRRLYRSADAVVTYGPHVSAYVAREGRAQRAGCAAVGGQRLLERCAARCHRSIRVAREERDEVPVRRAPRAGEGPRRAALRVARAIDRPRRGGARGSSGSSLRTCAAPRAGRERSPV